MSETHVPILLYVEDEAIVSMVVVEALEDAGFEVKHFFEGRAVLGALKEGATEYRGLVTDVRLPGVDGWEIARHARELNPSMPVVYVTGDSVAEWSSKGVPNSIVLQKPFATAQLVAAVTTLLNQVAVAPPAAAE